MVNAVLKLTQLGLSEYEATAYVSLLKEGPLTAYEISKKSGIPSSKVYEVVKKLETRHIIQSVQSERTRLYVPIAPEDFIEKYKAVVEGNLESVRTELKNIKVGVDTSLIWHVKDYDDLILRARRMIDTAQETILLSVWPQEVKILLPHLEIAEGRGIKIAIMHYGATNIKVGQVYRHPPEETIFSQKNSRGFALVTDSSKALTGKIEDQETEAIWSMNEGFVMIAEDYMRHDMFVMKIVSRLEPLLKKHFGPGYDKLRDVFSKD
ncbi:MAG: TrmB family transcriptional regulator [Nitrospirae bacterium]|nr:TrmB family transcriptional regulator [Nitrospirota bacterium]